MAPVMQQLVEKLRSLYSSGKCTQGGIAKYLGISAPQLSDVFAGRHGLTGSQVFRAQQLLKTMKTQERTMRPILDDEPIPGNGGGEDDHGEMSEEPKTLAEARAVLERKQSEVSFLQQKLAKHIGSKRAGHKFPLTLSSSAAETSAFIKPPAAPQGVTPAKGSASGQPSGLAFDPADQKSWDGFNKSQIDFPSDCDCPEKIAHHLGKVTAERLPWYLQGAPKTPTEKLQRQMVINELAARKGKR